MADLSKLYIESIKELRAWLMENHDNKESVWLVKWKKGHTENYITYDDIVDQLICFGWVDSLPRKLNDEQTMLRISPRNPKSNWSAVNKKRVEKLKKLNLMTNAGERIIQMAKENGAWDFLNDVEQLIIPEDLAKAFERYDNSASLFNRFPNSSKRGILEWIKSAKQPSTRANRIAETVEKASRNIKANHPKGRDAGPI